MLLRLRDKFKKDSGFTLIEVLLSSLIMIVVVGIVTMTYFNSVKSGEDTISVATSTQDARTTMYSVTKNIREISEIVSADVNEFEFKSNIDSDEDIEIVKYYTESDGGFFNLLRQVNGSNTKVVVKHLISDQIFSYTTGYGEDILTTPVDSGLLIDIRNVNIKLSIDQQSTTEGARTTNLETSVTLRNRI